MADIAAVNRCKPDMAGFILVPGRWRYVAPEDVASLRQTLDPDIAVVGVFVNEDLSEVTKLLLSGIIDIAQLHGNESPEYIRKLQKNTGKKVIKAFGVRSENDIRAAEESPADMILLDTPGGGTGSAFDWALLEKVKRPYILAGGLSTENVEEAIRRLQPFGVDVSSGIETDKVKDETKMQTFIACVRKG